MRSFEPARPPYLGAAYYPEAWPADLVDEDVSLMRKAGMTVMRMGEFAWSRMEPEEGCYDFRWLHDAVAKLGDAGIATILGTPSCTPPLWLTDRHPEILFLGQDGRRITHGGRRHTCPNSPVYRSYCERIVTAMAQEFGRDDRVIGWQIDNEVFPHRASRSCCCPVCRAGFSLFLQERYGSIDRMNEAWCTSLWSQTYQSFDQLPSPRSDVRHHPSLLAAWDEYASRSYVGFVSFQAALLHERVVQPVGTDMMMLPGVDHHAMNGQLDVVQFNHYHFRENLWAACFWFDYMRPLKRRPFWVTETATCWGGAVVASGYSDPGFCRANSWLPVAMGGEANLYWLWRQHRSGHELMHGAVIQSNGRPMHVWDEVCEVAAGFRAASGFLNSTRPDPGGLALHYSNQAHILFKNQPMVRDFDFQRDFLTRVYRPLLQAHFRPDVIHPSVDLRAYRVLVTCLIPSLEEGGLSNRIRDWVEAGGIWIVGPMSDIRTVEGARFTHAPFGILEELGGFYCSYQIPGDPRNFQLRWADGRISEGSLWYDALEPRGADVLAHYLEGPMKGMAAATRRRLGRGQVITLGTLPQAGDLAVLVGGSCGSSLAVADASEDVLVVPRSGAGGRGWVIVETSSRPGSVYIPEPAEDLLSGRDCSGEIDVPGYGVFVLRFRGR